MIKTPVKGMRDILPKDMEIRTYLLNIIETIATSAGYQKIETPAIEHLENLSSNQGGENESLIFKILKRGDSLTSALQSLTVQPLSTTQPSYQTPASPTQSPNATSTTTPSPTPLTDSALRYDLTVPLSRFYANNSNQLPSPLKALQIGPVWRADAPQKGRFRQFIQCDMDILGDASILAEIDTISTVLKILNQIKQAASIQGLTLHLNDRRLLLAATNYANIPEQQQLDALIILDKLDKIGIAGVEQELQAANFTTDSIQKLLDIFTNNTNSPTQFASAMQDFAPSPEVLQDIETLLFTLKSLDLPDLTINFNPTLVRGMGYYTGSIFECTADGLGSSIAGGGRYDRMIGDFLGGNKSVPACGFSIGFERLVTILADLNFTPPTTATKTALLLSPKLSSTDYLAAVKHAEKLRTSGVIVSLLPMARNLNHQISLLENSGYTTFHKIYQLQDLKA